MPQGDNIRVSRWFGLYGALLAAATIAFAWHLQHAGMDWRSFTWAGLAGAFRAMDGWIKLLVVLVYLSACTTLLPLPTGWIVAALATREAAIAPNIWMTTLLVAVVGAAGSTLANLNDYHFFTWLLRSRRVSRIRQTRFYDKVKNWFHSSPFFILVLFNVLPIPIDVIRLLAITCRYPRGRYAAANFIGRFIRYAFFAALTYYFDLGWKAPAALLGVAVLLVLGKALHSAYAKLHPAGAAG